MKLDLIFQGEPTLLSQKLQKWATTTTQHDVEVGWGVPPVRSKRKTDTSCLYFCELISQVMMPLIRLDKIDLFETESVVRAIFQEISSVTEHYQHIYVFDFVELINWKFLGYADATSATGKRNILQRANSTLRKITANDPRITVLPQDFFWDDQVPKISLEFFFRTHSVLTPSGIDRFIGHLNNFLISLSATRIKCICVDLDDTLWGGVAGEVEHVNELDIGGISAAGRSFQTLQYALRALRQSGIYLAIVSKNPISAVKKVFETHEEMVLKISDVRIFDLGYESKSDRIRKIATELNIGEDAILFLDDNPSERAEVLQHLPGVLVPDLPSSPVKVPDFLANCPDIKAFTLTQEDYARCISSRNSLAKFRSSGGTANLKIQSNIEIKLAESAHLPRIHQLINKTNQFTTRTTRLTRGELNILFLHPSSFFLVAYVNDDFHMLGLVGFISGFISDTECVVTDLIISCRAFGRGVENALFNRLFTDICPSKPVNVLLCRSSKNALAQRFVEALADDRDLVTVIEQ